MEQRRPTTPLVSIAHPSTEELKAHFGSLSLTASDSCKKHHVVVDIQESPTLPRAPSGENEEPVRFVPIKEEACLETGTPEAIGSQGLRFPPSTPEREFIDDLKIPPMSAEPNKPKPITISSLNQMLENFDPNAMYVFDIDETLVMSLFHKSVVLTQLERKLVDTAAKTQNRPLLEYVQLFVTERVRDRLDAKVLVEGQATIDLIHGLQDRGCWVFGLTSRYSSTVTRTADMLRKLGIDFSKSSPLPSDLSLQDPGTQAVYSHGVIYTNAIDKGIVLNRFLENVLLRSVADAQEKGEKRLDKERCEGAQDKPDSFSFEQSQQGSCRSPTKIIFVDDRLSNAESVQNGLSIAERAGIPVQTFHYMGAYVAAAAVANDGSPVSAATIMSTASQDGDICAPTIPASVVGFSSSSAATSNCDALSCLIDGLAVFYRKTVQNNIPKVQELGGQLHTLLRQLGQETPCQHMRRHRSSRKISSTSGATDAEGAPKNEVCGESS